MSNDRGRLTTQLFPDGDEPDARFTLANERTYLAWIRTGLACLAGGIGLAAFTITGMDPRAQKVAALGLVAVAFVVSVGAVIRWVRVERAMRTKRPLPAPTLAPILSLVLAIGAIVVIIGIL